jgi:hypothetical protein
MAITMHDKIKRILPANSSPIFYFYLKQVHYLILHRRTLEYSTSMRSIDDSIKLKKGVVSIDSIPVIKCRPFQIPA